MSQKTISLNGLQATTGSYLHPTWTPPQLAKLIRNAISQGDSILHDLGEEESGPTFLTPRYGVAPYDLSATGWGVVFAAHIGPEIRKALAPLLTHRQEQAGNLYHEFQGASAPQPKEDPLQWLSRHGVGPIAVVPERVPYYLLLVGDPVAIPFSFQHSLVKYAVGRLHLENLQAYANYARQIVEYELVEAPQDRRAVFFGPRISGDQATETSREYLVEPLAQKVEEKRPFWWVDAVPVEESHKNRLRQLLGGDPQHLPAPDLLFTAGHGLAFRPDDVYQRDRQGAFVCQGWPGPNSGRISPQNYVCAEDITKNFVSAGQVLVQFCCFGGGTPQYDTFKLHPSSATPPRLFTSQPFVARLPQRLLGLPHGCARGIIAQVGTAWGYSYIWRNVGALTENFEDVILRLTDGHPLGSAMEPIRQHYAALAVHLQNHSSDASDEELVDLWTATQDARGYSVFGDPATWLS